MHSDEQQIRELVATWMKATAEGDAETVLSLIADDAKFLVMGQPCFGREAFEAAADTQDATSIKIQGESDILEIKVVGDWAFMMTRLKVTIRQPDAEKMVRAGNTLTVLTKRDGKWLLYRDANLLAPVNDGDNY